MHWEFHGGRSLQECGRWDAPLSDLKVTLRKNRFPAESQLLFQIFSNFRPNATQHYPVFNQYYLVAIVFVFTFDACLTAGKKKARP
jgi:hypothetical protein